MYLYINKLALIQTAGRVWLLPASTKETRVGATIMLVSYSIYRRETLNGKSPTSAILPVGPDQTSFGILSGIRGENRFGSKASASGVNRLLGRNVLQGRGFLPTSPKIF